MQFLVIKNKNHRRIPVVLLLVEVRGIEPLSENLLIQLSSGVDYLLGFSFATPIIRLCNGAATFCLTDAVAFLGASSPLI